MNFKKSRHLLSFIIKATLNPVPSLCHFFFFLCLNEFMKSLSWTRIELAEVHEKFCGHRVFLKSGLPAFLLMALMCHWREWSLASWQPRPFFWSSLENSVPEMMEVYVVPRTATVTQQYNTISPIIIANSASIGIICNFPCNLCFQHCYSNTP